MLAESGVRLSFQSCEIAELGTRGGEAGRDLFRCRRKGEKEEGKKKKKRKGKKEEERRSEKKRKMEERKSKGRRGRGKKKKGGEDPKEEEFFFLFFFFLKGEEFGRLRDHFSRGSPYWCLEEHIFCILLCLRI